jgi:hypothetical protein
MRPEDVNLVSALITLTATLLALLHTILQGSLVRVQVPFSGSKVGVRIKKNFN